MGHDNQLKRLLEGARGRPIPPGPSSGGHLDEILDVKLAGVRADILSGFERRLTNLENHCDVKIGEVQKQCHKDHLDGQEQMQQSLDGRETGIREELGSLQAQIQGLTLTESCCGQVPRCNWRKHEKKKQRNAKNLRSRDCFLKKKKHQIVQDEENHLQL